MADTRRGKDGRLGPYRLGRRHGSKDSEMGRLYEAHNVHTDAPALVLVPGPSEGGEPEEDCQVRVTAQARPPYVALEVEQAPATGGLAGLAGLFEVLTRMMERMEWSDEARRHLTHPPEGRLKRWTSGARRVLGKGVEHGVGLLIVAIVALVLLMVAAHVRAYLKSQRGEQHEAGGVAVQVVEESHAPTLVDTGDEGPAGVTYPLPTKPFSDQAKAPCKPNLHEVQLNGGCWLELAVRPPCGENYAEFQGKCYVPVSARSRKPREPQSIQP